MSIRIASRGFVGFRASTLMSCLALVVVGCGAPTAGADQPPHGSNTTTMTIPSSRIVSDSAAASSELRDVPHIPSSSAVRLPEEPVGEAIYHEAASGDTPATVARRYQTTTEKLLRHNGLNSSADLEPGQLLAIPQ